MITSILILIANLYTAYCRYKEKKLYPGENKYKKRIVALAVADAVIIGALVALGWTTMPQWYYRVSVVLAGVLGEILLVGLMAQWWTGKRLILPFLMALLAVGGLWGSARYEAYLRDITLEEYFNTWDYVPFTEGSKVKNLGEEATLRFSDDREALPRMDGATALYPVYAAFAQATYPESLGELIEPEIQHIVSCSTTSHAYQRIVDGKCDIIFVAGPSAAQEDYAAEKGVELNYTPIGREAFVFFVHPDNPVSGLTVKQLRSIYSGEITRWEQLGAGASGRILAYQRSEGSGSQTALERFVMQGAPVMPAEKETYFDSMGGIVEQVAQYKNQERAIGFSFRFYCTELLKNFKVKLLNVDGVAPTLENIENGDYPLASYFYAVTRSDADENTLKLLNWITSEPGPALVEQCGYTRAGEEWE